jgi:hypothetical protein
MKNKDIYEIWKTDKKKVDITSDFSVRVMNKIYKYEKQENQGFFAIYRLIDAVFANPFAKVGMIAAGATAGVLRIVFLLYALLWC